MYIPKHYLATDRNEIVAFMKAYSFAAVITAKDDLPLVTHVPLVITETNGTLLLTGHFSKANEQWKALERGKVLVVFGGPHAYISPSHYEGELNVPTWNYIAVHAYGQAEIVTAAETVYEALREMINIYEQAYETQWDSLPEAYKTKMVNGIVCFRITVTDLQAKKKLSQNKKETERERIITALEKSSDGAGQAIAAFMKQNKTHGT